MYDNFFNSCEKIIKIYRRVLMKNVLIQVFPGKKRKFVKKSPTGFEPGTSRL